MTTDMSPEMQKAAVEAAVGSGMTVDEVGVQFPYLADGIELYKKDQKKPRPRRGSGSIAPIGRSARPTI